MTRPDDISESAWEAAGKALEPVSGTYAPAQLLIARAIQEAVMMEREGCAKVVETYGPQHYYNQHGQERGLSEIESALSQAIRNRKD